MIICISDLDGTLLNESAQVSDYSVDIINDAIGKGVCFTVATARTPLSALPILQGLNISCPMILMNGALLYSPEKRLFSHSVGFPESSVCSIADAERHTGMGGMVFSMEDGRLHLNLGSVSGKLWDRYFDMSRVAHVSAICPAVHERGARDLAGRQILYALYMDDKPEALQRMTDMLSADTGLTLDYYKDKYTENRWCLEISGIRASKGTAVRLLRERYHPERIIAFGDSLNDVPLFDACDEGYAVANASDELKARATGIIGSNLQDGVAKFIRDYLRDMEGERADGRNSI